MRHPGPDGAKSKLIVVAEIDDQQLGQHVDRLLSDHEVRLVEANELPSFAAEFEREAHISVPWPPGSSTHFPLPPRLGGCQWALGRDG